MIAWGVIDHKGINKPKIKIQGIRFLYLDQAKANRASVMIFVELDGRCDDLPVYAQQQQKPGSQVNLSGRIRPADSLRWRFKRTALYSSDQTRNRGRTS